MLPTNLLTFTTLAGAPAAAGAYESIASVTAAGGESSLEFTSIPSTYQHLQVRLLAKNTRTADSAWGSSRMRINSDSGTNYTFHFLQGDGAAVSASGGTALDYAFGPGVPGSGGSNTSTFAAHIIDIHDYASTTKNKTVRWLGGVDQNTSTANRNIIALFSNLWLSTNAITSLTFSHGDGNWSSGSTFALYGIKGA
jgi:hypothetical protein